MKLTKYFTIACMMVSLAGCDYLDFDESIGKEQEDMYSYFENISSLATYVYSQLPQDFGAVNGAVRDAATDNAVYTWNSNPVYNIYNGSWSPLTPVDDVWTAYYGAIRAANSFLENYSLEKLNRLQWNANYEENIKKAKMYVHEVRALRAFYYLELAKRYGDIPLLTRTYQVDEINQVKETPFDQVIDFIDRECSEVAPELPVSHTEFYNETGRVTRGMALSVRARALLYAASPLHNPTGDKQKWEKAATASYAIIKEGWYSLPSIDNDPLYSKNGGNDVLKSSQLIFERRNGASNSFESLNLPIGYENGNSGSTPTQNLVDAYELNDGTPFDWNNPRHSARPYVNRDPRFYKTILYNGSSFMESTVETFEGGRNAAPINGATLTGYYLKKYMNETVSLSPTAPSSKPHHFILFRYAETLLNYAEAMDVLGGADYTVADRLPMSARTAVNQVRTAAGMPAIDDNGEDFTRRLRNERRVELAFEDHRYWDLCRWKEGELMKDIYGVKIIRKGRNKYSYSRIKIQSRVWEPKMYLYPIAQEELYKNPNLTQNSGWE